MKYEMIFGEQLFFDGAPDDIVAVRLNNYSRISHGYLTKEKLDTLSVMGLKAIPIVAMRRIIEEPKRWTVADQKAGRLPEVGSKYLGKNELNPEAELICDLIDGDECVWGHDKNKKMFCFYASNIKPIETPAEKAQRLRSEWVKHALDLYMSSPKNDVASMGDVYDALLSGELKAPAVE